MKNLDKLVNYYKENEKKEDNLKLGVEFEHILLDDKANARSYYDAGGTGDLFRAMVELGWEANYEGENILSIEKNELSISTEPGGQLEFSTNPISNVCDIKGELLKFYDDAVDVLKDYNSDIYTLGFQPNSNVDDIKILPRDRYYAMYDYFKTSGKTGKFMMKGTASLQCSIDYTSEYDYGRKYSLANKLSNILYCLFDNAPFKNGRPLDIYAFRSYIWNNTDRKRCGNFECAFREDFKYEDYAKFLLDNDAIFVLDNGNFKKFDGKIDEAMTDADKKGMEHLMTMVFPDVRTKNFIEIRQIDSILFPYNLGAVALIQAIFYNEDNFDRVYNLIGDLSFKESERARLDMYKMGPKAKMMGKTIATWGVDILSALEFDPRAEKFIKKIAPLMEGDTLRRRAVESWKKYAMVENAIQYAKVDLEGLDV